MRYEPTSLGLLKPIIHWLQDVEVSEILVNKPQIVYIEKQGQMERHEIPEWDERTLQLLFQLIANENEQRLTKEKPLLSGNLQDGSRVQIVLPPVSGYPTLAIRRQVLKDLQLKNYQGMKVYSHTQAFELENASRYLPQSEHELIALYKKPDWDAFIHKAIECKKNIVISGGTSSGKTTFLNACIAEIPLSDRLILLEDTREINVPHDNVVNLLATKGEQGIAKVTLQELVQCALRLRPDRIICGEIRGKEILDFIAACSTGHEGSMTTIHANNPQLAFMRMMQLYKQNNVPSMRDEEILQELKSVIDIIIQLEKSAEGRRVQSIYYKHA